MGLGSSLPENYRGGIVRSGFILSDMVFVVEYPGAVFLFTQTRSVTEWSVPSLALKLRQQ